jgi:hypothetical protein
MIKTFEVRSLDKLPPEVKALIEFKRSQRLIEESVIEMIGKYTLPDLLYSHHWEYEKNIRNTYKKIRGWSNDDNNKTL